MVKMKFFNFLKLHGYLNINEVMGQKKYMITGSGEAGLKIMVMLCMEEKGAGGLGA